MSQRKVYDKPYLPPEDLLNYLKSRNLIVEDESEAKKVLSEINWYCLKAYFHNFLDEKNNFIEGATFLQGINQYFFDEELRQIIIKGALKFELLVRTKIDQILTKEFDSLWYLQDKIFTDPPYHERVRIKNDLDRSKYPYAKHFKKNYISENASYLSLPPSWIAMELISFDHFLKIFQSIDYQKINRLSPLIEYLILIGADNLSNLDNWLNTVKRVRNIACHNGRLWNAWHLQPKGLNIDNKSNSIFNVIYIIEKVTSKSFYNQNLSLKKDFLALLSKYEESITGLKHTLGVKQEMLDDLGWV